MSMKQLLSQMSNYIRSLEKEGLHIKELEFLNPSSNVDVNAFK